MPIVIKDRFDRIARKYAGRILLMEYGGGIRKSIAFTPLAEADCVNSGMICECGHAVFNATNFNNVIHFCPTREYEVTVTDYATTQT